MSTFLRYAAKNGILIDLLQGMDEQELQTALRYGTHASPFKDVDFIHAGLAEQFQVGNVDVFPLDAVMVIHNLWLPP